MIESAENSLRFHLGPQPQRSRQRPHVDFALVRAIEIVGEAASRITVPTREAAADIPWPLIVSMRNRLIHAYFDVDPEVVWKTVSVELPQLLPRLRLLLQEADGG